MKRIAALTTVRNGGAFLERWIAYYGAALGRENLTVIFEGLEQTLPDGVTDVNTIHVPFENHKRSKGDSIRAARASDVARDLLADYDLVIGCDVDEILIADPAVSDDLGTYLSGLAIDGCVSGMGIDVACNTRHEADLNWDKPLLGQRRFAVISDRYTKASVLSKPLRWGSGFHRVKGHGFTIDPNLFLFHFGSVDAKANAEKQADEEKIAAGWAGHQKRRDSLVDDISDAETIIHGDARFETARAELSRKRSLIAWNKPRPLAADKVIEIPERFLDRV